MNLVLQVDLPFIYHYRRCCRSFVDRSFVDLLRYLLSSWYGDLSARWFVFLFTITIFLLYILSIFYVLPVCCTLSFAPLPFAIFLPAFLQPAFAARCILLPVVVVDVILLNRSFVAVDFVDLLPVLLSICYTSSSLAFCTLRILHHFYLYHMILHLLSIFYTLHLSFLHRSDSIYHIVAFCIYIFEVLILHITSFAYLSTTRCRHSHWIYHIPSRRSSSIPGVVEFHHIVARVERWPVDGDHLSMPVVVHLLSIFCCRRWSFTSRSFVFVQSVQSIVHLYFVHLLYIYLTVTGQLLLPVVVARWVVVHDRCYLPFCLFWYLFVDLHWITSSILSIFIYIYTWSLLPALLLPVCWYLAVI